MPISTLIIGGCRSGKSSHALLLGQDLLGICNVFVATCQPRDAEMKTRVLRHQHERGDLWQTIEAPLDIVDVVERMGPVANIMLIDCLTLWISNLMMAHDTDDDIVEEMERLHEAIQKPPCPIIIVSNEVGLGIVPENELARRFRDLTGWCNQKIASGCNRVIWMAAGIPINIK